MYGPNLYHLPKSKDLKAASIVVRIDGKHVRVEPTKELLSNIASYLPSACEYYDQCSVAKIEESITDKGAGHGTHVNELFPCLRFPISSSMLRAIIYRSIMFATDCYAAEQIVSLLHD
jgi:hypothetical protein